MIHDLSKEEMAIYLDQVYNRLLEHRYRYYILDHPALSDAEYDFVERHYNELVAIHGGKSMQMVDFDFKDPIAIEAGKRVDSRTDNYSIWYDGMKPVWDKLGFSRHQK